jgi:hypothetical protein
VEARESHNGQAASSSGTSTPPLEDRTVLFDRFDPGTAPLAPASRIPDSISDMGQAETTRFANYSGAASQPRRSRFNLP